MLSRRATAFLVLASLAGGLVTGFSLGRGTPVLSAQVGATSRQDPHIAAASPSEGESKARKAGRSDSAVYDELAREYDRFAHVNRMFEMVAKAVSPTVVHIVAEKTSRHPETQRVRKFEETGSGVIVRCEKSPGLFVLTNHHVVEGGKIDKIRIFLHDGRALIPQRIWSDGKADIAVLKLERDDLPAARLGDSNAASVGSWVLALGSPFGLMHSVSQGIISARGRHMEELADLENQDFLQTDAAINPGNSGGPLVNMKGEVIGINNSIASNGGGNEGVGFSIPINLAHWIMDELIAHGRVTRGALGVDLQPEFQPEDAVRLGLDRPRGAWIDKVHAESPAARGGIHDGDIVLNFGGVDIHDLNHLINTVSMTPVGVPSEVVVWRDRREVRLKVTVGERERTLAQAPAMPADHGANDPSALIRRPNRPGSTSSFALGLELATLTPQAALRMDLPEGMQGALIISVDPESALAQALKLNDVVAIVNEQPIVTAEQASRLINERSEHDRLIVSVDRRGGNGAIERHTYRVP